MKACPAALWHEFSASLLVATLMVGVVPAWGRNGHACDGPASCEAAWAAGEHSLMQVASRRQRSSSWDQIGGDAILANPSFAHALIAGTSVEVTENLTPDGTDKDKYVKLLPGVRGVIEETNDKGDALIKFDGVNLEVWVSKSNVAKLKEIPLLSQETDNPGQVPMGGLRGVIREEIDYALQPFQYVIDHKLGVTTTTTTTTTTVAEEADTEGEKPPSAGAGDMAGWEFHTRSVLNQISRMGADMARLRRRLGGIMLSNFTISSLRQELGIEHKMTQQEADAAILDLMPKVAKMQKYMAKVRKHLDFPSQDELMEAAFRGWMLNADEADSSDIYAGVKCSKCPTVPPTTTPGPEYYAAARKAAAEMALGLPVPCGGGEPTPAPCSNGAGPAGAGPSGKGGLAPSGKPWLAFPAVGGGILLVPEDGWTKGNELARTADMTELRHPWAKNKKAVRGCLHPIWKDYHAVDKKDTIDPADFIPFHKHHYKHFQLADDGISCACRTLGHIMEQPFPDVPAKWVVRAFCMIKPGAPKEGTCHNTALHLMGQTVRRDDDGWCIGKEDDWNDLAITAPPPRP